ncbi:hypothetical protein F4804DRAFT_304514 [Jackrogersella minutella]|nr:hypothetical protein F4804DRAFT_304514 [Jackrogersella minutella]
MAAKEATRAEQERIAAQEHRENEARHNFKLSVEALKSHLEDKDDNQPSADIYGKAKGDVHNGTCTWLFNRHEFTEWIAPESKHPILWLNGKHGAGKTVLCSKAIDHLETTQESLVIIHQFLSNDDYIPKNRLLRIFSTELLHHILKQRTIALPTSIKPFLNVRKNESSKLEELIDCLILELPLTYIFIDGLDEVESSIQKRHSSVSDRSHWEQDVQELMSFLFRKAVLRPEKLRVWCSSQSLPRIRNHLYNDNWRHALLEIGMATGDTKSDIKKYLMSSISESTDPMGSMFAELFVGAALATEVEGSFLWASSMLRDLKMRADTPHDLIELARQGLPSRMSEVYQQVINRIKERDGKMSNPPLWKIVLSLLTFAKRPLKVGEVREAIAMIWTSNGNLDKFKVVPKDKILNSCVSLIWCSNTKEDDTGILRLSHSAVRKHVLENIDLGIDSTDDNGLGGSWIIRECCLRYLSQPRYAKPLRKLSPTGSWACDNEHITSQQLLLYAAKYWFQHFDTPVDANSGDNIPEAERDKVKKFLYSPQFRTCIQVQSLFVTGHFLQRFDPITDRGILIRKTLPNWTQQYEDTLNQQYLYFQGEWCRLLQFGRFTGEMDRCLWSALGPEHFFSHGQSRYHNFQFRQSEKVEQTRNRCQVQHVSQDGRRLMVAWIHEENRCLCLEHWKLDGKRDPQIKSTTIIPFSENANHLSRYSSPCSQTFRSIPLLPRVQSVAPVDAMAIRLDASLIRIGSKMYYWSPGSNDALGSYMPLEESFGESWEEVCVRDSFLVLCRQRIYRQQPKTTTEERERERVRWMRNQRETFERSRSRTRSGSSRVRLQVKVKESKLIPSFVIEETDSDSLTTQSDSSESIPNYEEFPDFSAAEESWSDRSTSTKYASSDDLYSHGSDDSKSDDSDSDIKSQLSGDDTESDIKSVLSVESDDENSSGSESIMSMSRVTWSSESESEDSCIGGDLSEDEIIEAEPAEIYAEPLCPVGISQPQSKKICDCCNRGHLREWYHCIICNNGDLDLCESCESRGMWCLDLEHQLYRIVNRKPTGVVSRRNFSVRQELVVYQMDKPENERLVFHFRNKYPTMLHDSAPVIHPTKPLVVWSLCDSLLLFADFNNNTYFEQKIKAKTSKKAHQICANLSFSPCGAFLRVAIIDATAQKPNSVAALDINGSDTTKRRLCLNLHVLILRLSATSPTKNPPKLLRTTSCLLGCSCARPFIPVLPFAFTWTDADLYLTISESYLRVYHVALPDLREQHCDSVDTPTGISSGFTITVPGETILLPRSSHNRSVQFFPATKPGGNATVIIGPRGGYHPSPPIGVYLSERDLGIWVCPEERNEGGGMYNPQITLEGQLEEPWDDDNDCIIIPFDGY